MHDDRQQTEQRLHRVLTRRLPHALYRQTGIEPELTVWHAPGEPVPATDAIGQEYQPIAPGDPWGRAWSTSWIHVTAEVPEEYADTTLELVVDLGYTGGPGFTCEGLIHTPDGIPVKGVHPENRYLVLPAGTTTIDLYIEAAANPDVGGTGFDPTPYGDWDSAGDEPIYRLGAIEVLVPEPEVAALRHDLEVAGDLAKSLPSEQARRWQLTAAIGRALDRLDTADIVGTAAAARAELTEALALPATASAHRITAVGHAHIDSAWLWPLRETVRKVARTVSNVCALAEDYPELVFAFSSAQQHAWVRDHHPQVWERLKKAVADGVVVPVGGMWVESDTNMVGAEAMCRQFVQGKRFFLDEYGIETDEVWLPDSFGYAAGLPQIVDQSATTYFLTQKISWNRVNKFPHHTFWWEGIDGTRVFTHFPSADTYNGTIRDEISHASSNYADKAGNNRSLLPFGYGDGGGGPTREMMERIRRTGDLEGSPVVGIDTPAGFFDKAHDELAESAAVWSGELYLELHRGTLTSQHRTKQGNRRNEHLLREAELWAATAAVRHGADYPQEQLDRLWQQVLLLQFHDILPGTSIHWVHREAEQMHAQITAELEELIGNAQQVLAGDGDVAVVFNAAVSERDGVPAMGAARVRDRAKVKVAKQGKGWTISNGLITVTVDASGVLTSVIDHTDDTGETDREVLAGPSNLLQLHQDFPVRWDAWDVDSYYRNNVTDVTGVDTVRTIERGVEITRSVGGSTLVQTITVQPGENRVDFTLDVDWQETEKFLKAAFVLDIAADRSAAETQFGHLFRPTHANTSWDAARFEVAAHRYLHVAEEGYGAALVNESTYGHDVRRVSVGNEIATEARLSLLRAPRYPDPDTDRGEHSFRYALAVEADTTRAVQEGYAINLPPRTVAGQGRAVAPLVSVDNPEIVVSAVKLADDGSGDVIVRLYQATGARSHGVLATDFGAKSVVATDLLERPIGKRRKGASPISADSRAARLKPVLRSGEVELDLRPFQMATLRFTR
ncbi:MAG TPA: alpha-mannosidase [Candidatus Avipropionibacterium avicola]|uniref:Alpha-mannosidase n=1 Tax=Candidatus Avipropionibacterium avicola TaxID=2840701 RepID=A0A9D1GXR7_9ACTN|nr:alpha-mannosidase [Candidatus Avipropionibacterium avicola]